jgi:hypothetical protein
MVPVTPTRQDQQWLPARRFTGRPEQRLALSELGKSAFHILKKHYFHNPFGKVEP